MNLTAMDCWRIDSRITTQILTNVCTCQDIDRSGKTLFHLDPHREVTNQAIAAAAASAMSSNIQQSFDAGKAHAEGECQARRAVETVKDAAGAGADSAQQQPHRAAGAIHQTGEQVAQAAQNAATAAKDAVAGAGSH
ncbi:hypothetical protein E2562_025017 [Oryza meyeriana var. granulata]|uniref:Uncharacterized protein n=1 Tax=Oryza meyeriana var. granulata TaxID=110450 RepID=A0A6G1FBT3_9ORYZ|nr:hypothetical protein E2562_025017 [Oryza meyeriana var. granulata]